MALACQITIMFMAAFLAKGLAASSQLSKIKPCQFNCSPRNTQGGSTFSAGNVLKKSKSAEDKLFNPWIGRRKKQSEDSLRKPVGQALSNLNHEVMDSLHLATVALKCAESGNSWADFCIHFKKMYRPDLLKSYWLLFYGKQDNPWAINENEIKDLRMRTLSDIVWSRFVRYIWKKNPLQMGLKNISDVNKIKNALTEIDLSVESQRKNFEWDRLN